MVTPVKDAGASEQGGGGPLTAPPPPGRTASLHRMGRIADVRVPGYNSGFLAAFLNFASGILNYADPRTHTNSHPESWIEGQVPESDLRLDLRTSCSQEQLGVAGRSAEKRQ